MKRSSRLLVQERRKILTEHGKDLAEVAVPHNDFIRLSGFKGRTVLPDGREVPLGSRWARSRGSPPRPRTRRPW